MENLSKFTFINCICCGKKIELLDKVKGLTDEQIFDTTDWLPEQQMWNNGVVENMSASYGSSLDGDYFYLGICDPCIGEGYNNGRLRYKAPVICKFSEDELKKQDEMRNREKNLNDLIP